MSEASKKRLPLHKHLSYQIVEASREEFSPRERGVHATDVLLDSTVSLAETLTSFTRLWEAEVAEEIASWAETVDDTAASNEKAIKVPISNLSTGDILAFVKSENLNLAGNLYYVVRLKVSDNTPTSDIAKIQVYDEAGATVLAEWIVAPNDFPNANQYHHFACLFELPKDKTQITFKVILITAGLADLWIDYGGLIPKTMPIGYADVTILTTDPGTDAAANSTGLTVDSKNPLTDAAANSTGLSVDSKNPLTDAAANSTGLSIDTKNPLTDALIADGMTRMIVVDAAPTTKKTIGTTLTTLISATPTAVANPIELALATVKFTTISGEPFAHVLLKIEYYTGTGYLTAAMIPIWLDYDMGNVYIHHSIPYQLSYQAGKVERVILKAIATVSVDVYVAFRVFQYKKHDHSITGDEHDHTTTEYDHDHSITGDEHDHTTTEYDHDHSITGDEHDHGTTEYDHDHLISGDSHDHTGDAGGHQH